MQNFFLLIFSLCGLFSSAYMSSCVIYSEEISRWVEFQQKANVEAVGAAKEYVVVIRNVIIFTGLTHMDKMEKKREM